MQTEYEALFASIDEYARRELKKSRYEHSVRVAETCRLMCGIYGLDENKGYLAGLSHDICKSLDDESVAALAALDSKPFCEDETANPQLLHGRAAAIVLRRDFGVDDAQVLEAVACHTLGGVDLCPLSKVLYSADKIEPGRPQSTPEYRERLFRKSLTALTLDVLDESIAYLWSKAQKKPSDRTVEFRQSLLDDIASHRDIESSFEGI